MHLDDPLEARREKRRRQSRRRLVAAVVIVGVVLAGGAVVGLTMLAQRHRDPGGSPQVLRGSPSDDWTHAELAAHLKQRGVPVEVGSGGPGFGGGVSSSFTDPVTEQWVSVSLVADTKAARELAGANPKAFAFGRFVIRPMVARCEPYADRIRAALD